MKFIEIFTITFALFIGTSMAQRGSYAGARPQGYKDKYAPHTSEIIANRVEVDNRVDGTTQRLPVQAYGDIQYVNYLNSLPVEKRPFWFINYQAIEAAQRQPFPVVQPQVGAAPFAG